MESLLNLDYYLFDLVNQKWSNPFFDFILKWMRDIYIWIPLYIFTILFFAYNYGRKAYWIIIFGLLTFATSDTLSSRLIKNSVQRLRPCRDGSIEHIYVLVKCGSAYSFTSSHATNHFAIATFFAFTFGLVYRKIRWPLFIWAALIGFSQVYVGVHFPLDVLCGSIIGIIIGFLWAKLFNRYFEFV